MSVTQESSLPTPSEGVMAFSGGPFDVRSGWSPGLCSVEDDSKGGAEAEGWEGFLACGGGV